MKFVIYYLHFVCSSLSQDFIDFVFSAVEKRSVDSEIRKNFIVATSHSNFRVSINQIISN